ncbi:MAG: 30S ribosomal protein S3 [Candidatus Thermoplasmatota archaeon]|nr:30S ribosomal protein S3 [Candidatus Thermoplasmatota archaeon]
MAIERKFVQEGAKRMLIREYLEHETERAGFGGLEIQRTPLGTLLSLSTERPGIVIGRGGKNVKALTQNLEDHFGLENPQLEVEEIGNQAPLNGQIMAQKVASALERGWHFRRVGHSTVRRIMGSGARGCQVIISGKITGSRHRTEKFTKGHVKYCGEVASQVMDEGIAVAKKKAGVLGVKVRIMRPDAKMPDEVEIVHEPEEQEETAEPGAEETEEKATETSEKPKEKPAAKKPAKKKQQRKQKKQKPAPEETKEPAPEASPMDELNLKDITGIGGSMMKRLQKAGIEDVRELYEMSIDDLTEVKGIGVKKAKQLKEAIEKAVNQ